MKKWFKPHSCKCYLLLWRSVALVLFLLPCVQAGDVKNSAGFEVKMQAGDVFVSAQSAVSTREAYRHALLSCEKKRKLKGVVAYCEPTFIGDEPVVSAAQLRRRALTKKISASGAPNYLSLYEIKHGNATVFLFGSVHLMKRNIYPLHPLILESFHSADSLVLEINMAAIEPQRLNEAFVSRGFYQDGSVLQDVLADSFLSRIDRVLSRRGLMVENYQKMRPWFFEQTLITQEMMLYGFNADAGLDSYFEGLAQRSGKAVLELETLGQQLDLLSGSSLDEQLWSLEYTLDGFLRQSIQAELNALVVEWLKGDADHLFEYMTEPLRAYPKLAPFIQRMFDDRNAKMVKKVDHWLQGDGRYFIVVGAGHLGGNKGLIKLLQAEGYTVSQKQR